MTLSIHPEAARRVEELARKVREALDPDVPQAEYEVPAYQPRRPVAGSIKPEDLRAPMVTKFSDRFGQEIARVSDHPNQPLGLKGAAHAEFMKLVQTVHRQRAVRDTVSLETLRDVAFETLCDARRSGTDPDFCASVLGKLEQLIGDQTVVVPIYGLHVQEAITLGRVSIADVTDSELQTWRQLSLEHAPQQQVTQANQYHDKLRLKMAGRAAARFQVRAELEHAIQTALEETDLSLAILRLFSVGAFAPERASNVTPLGREAFERANAVVLSADASFSAREAALFPDEMKPWVLAREWILTRLRPVIEPWSVLLQQPERSPFEQDALKSVLLYSRATRYRNISEKLIHIFSAVEALLLRNDSEPIASALADRLAFAVGRDAQQRIEIAANLRTVYKMRSRYVHHAAETQPDQADLKVLETFLATISQFFINLSRVLKQYESREAFIDALERRKYQ